MPPALRDRLAQASSQVVAQRESLARATAALDRALDVLLPREGAGLYSIYGAADRGMYKSGVIRAWSRRAASRRGADPPVADQAVPCCVEPSSLAMRTLVSRPP